jgi:prepilin-type N-terminal cleavage/methylation domain-containing protein
MPRLIRNRAEEGFTLVEVIVAITIVAIGIIGLSAVFPLATRDVAKSGGLTKAMELCQGKIEALHALAYDSPDLAPGYVHADSLNPIADVYVRTWETYDNDPIAGCKLIEVTVSWESVSDAEVRLSTVIASAGR